MMVLLLFTACNTADPCAAMCSAASRVYGGCLSHWGAEWRDAGFEDARDYFHSCETWAWEMRLLERSALKRGAVDEGGHVDAQCVDLEQRLLSDEMSCAEWSAIEWEAPPWLP